MLRIFFFLRNRVNDKKIGTRLLIDTDTGIYDNGHELLRKKLTGLKEIQKGEIGIIKERRVREEV